MFGVKAHSRTCSLKSHHTPTGRSLYKHFLTRWASKTLLLFFFTPFFCFLDARLSATRSKLLLWPFWSVFTDTVMGLGLLLGVYRRPEWVRIYWLTWVLIKGSCLADSGIEVIHSLLVLLCFNGDYNNVTHNSRMKCTNTHVPYICFHWNCLGIWIRSNFR